MNGKMPLTLNRGFYFEVYGGPYRKLPEGMAGVKMAEEIHAHCKVSVPTRDFHTPPYAVAAQGLIDTLKYVMSGTPVYIGCAGGIGRTGLMLALLAKAWGIKDPVAYVRQHYIPHAVETAHQKEYVETFVIPNEAIKLIKKQRLLSWLRFGPKNLTIRD